MPRGNENIKEHGYKREDPDKEPKSVVITIRVTPSEAEEIDKQSDGNRSGFCREAVQDRLNTTK